MTRTLLSKFVCTALALLLVAAAASAQEAGTGGDAVPDPVMSEDQQFLVDAFQNDLVGRVDDAVEDVAVAQRNLDAAVASEIATEDEIAALGAALTEAQQALGLAQADLDALADLVGELSEEQVTALIRSLTNAYASGLSLALDPALMQQIVDGDYDRHDIQALTQGLEQEARFLEKRDRFATRAAARTESGKPGGGQMERFEAKATAEKDKFMAKIEEPDVEAVDTTTADALITDAVSDAVEDAAREAAKETGRDAAKQAAKAEARMLAKATAQEVAKQTGKRALAKGNGQTN